MENNLEKAAREYSVENPIEHGIPDTDESYDLQKPKQDFIEGAKWEKEQLIKKACKWLRKHKDSYAVCDIRTDKMSVANKLIFDFKKAMEEEK